MRSQAKVDTLYYIKEGGVFAVTPDGIGFYWFDDFEDVEEQYGEGHFTGYTTITRLSDY